MLVFLFHVFEAKFNRISNRELLAVTDDASSQLSITILLLFTCKPALHATC